MPLRHEFSEDVNGRDRLFHLAIASMHAGHVAVATITGTEIVAPLITKNTEIPYIYTSSDGQFGTAEANQSTIELVLMEADGDSLDPEHCKEIGRGTVELPAGVPKGAEVNTGIDLAIHHLSTFRSGKWVTWALRSRRSTTLISEHKTFTGGNE